MADGFKIDPAAPHVGSSDMFVAIGEAAVELLSHEDGLVAAPPGWVGSSQLTLAELAARWEIRTCSRSTTFPVAGTVRPVRRPARARQPCGLLESA